MKTKFGIRIVFQEYIGDNEECRDVFDLFEIVPGLPKDALNHAEAWISYIRDRYDEEDDL
jgi:hypothetical protein